ncbi:MAG: SprT-like domain-containing protein [Gammaproteobacteria bacterium]|nr:SprT-like domain-containing protein [Gammaproteobacteria bacterium]
MTQTVIPIGQEARRQVAAATERWIQRAGRVFGRLLPDIPVTFDLSGRAFGMYRVDRRGRVIRYNPYLFAKYYAEGLAVAVPHEVGHYVTDILYGHTSILAHGPEWQRVMDTLGVAYRPGIKIDLTGIPVRRHRRFDYCCACRIHRLTTRSHNKITRGTVAYRCRRCDTALVYVAEQDCHSV